MEKNKKLFAEINDKKIKYGVFQLDDEKNYKLLFRKNSQNDGIQNGVVTDLNLATDIVSEDLNEIEKKVDTVFGDTNLIINQKEMFSTNLTSFKNLNGAKVEKRDLDYILNDAKNSIIRNEEKNTILHILNSNFYLDKKRREKIPLNIFGDHLGLQMTFLSLPKNNIKNIKNLFESNDLKVDRYLCKPLTIGINLVNENNSLKNFFLINIDDELSTISVYENYSLVFFKTFPFGTNTIFRDITQLCSITKDETEAILCEINFDKKKEKETKYIEKKFFKDTQFTKLSVSHFKNIIDSRIEEMINYLFNKNSNLSYFKNRLSHIYLVFENEISHNNLSEVFKNHLNFDKEKIALRIIKLDDLSLFGAAELIFKGWHAEAIPFVQKKKSLFSGVFSRFFN